MVGTFTAEEFDTQRFDLPDSGRWHELESGELVILEPPEDLHGSVVFNLSTTIGKWLHKQAGQSDGYAAFDLGLIVARCPDTVLRPPMSFFTGGSRFARCDETLTGDCPRLIVEIASTNDRRTRMRERVRDYLSLGVETIWIAETDKREISIVKKNEATLLLAEHHTLKDDSVLPGFAIPVKEVFREPDWE